MTTYVIRNGELVEKGSRSGNTAPHVIRDTMDPTLHMADGKLYDSKRAFRAATKAAGCIEIGTQKDYGMKRSFKPTLDKRERVEAIKRTIYELQNGRR